MQKNKFIVIEGIDGSGKSTLAELLQRKLEYELKIDTVQTSEPSMCSEAFKDCPDFYYFDRLHHLYKPGGIITQLKTSWVICDRYHDSNIVYNDQINDYLIRKPDHTIFLDINPHLAHKRLLVRDEKPEQTFYELYKLSHKYRDLYHNVKDIIWIESLNLNKQIEIILEKIL